MLCEISLSYPRFIKHNMVMFTQELNRRDCLRLYVHTAETKASIKLKWAYLVLQNLICAKKVTF